MTNYYILSIYIVPLISVDGQASPRLFIAPEIRHEKISYNNNISFITNPLLIYTQSIWLSFHLLFTRTSDVLMFIRQQRETCSEVFSNFC